MIGKILKKISQERRIRNLEKRLEKLFNLNVKITKTLEESIQVSEDLKKICFEYRDLCEKLKKENNHYRQVINDNISHIE